MNHRSPEWLIWKCAGLCCVAHTCGLPEELHRLIVMWDPHAAFSWPLAFVPPHVSSYFEGKQNVYIECSSVWQWKWWIELILLMRKYYKTSKDNSAGKQHRKDLCRMSYPDCWGTVQYYKTWGSHHLKGCKIICVILFVTSPVMSSKWHFNQYLTEPDCLSYWNA